MEDQFKEESAPLPSETAHPLIERSSQFLVSIPITPRNRNILKNQLKKQSSAYSEDEEFNSAAVRMSQVSEPLEMSMKSVKCKADEINKYEEVKKEPQESKNDDEDDFQTLISCKLIATEHVNP